MKAICIKTKLRKDFIDEVREWFKKLNDRMEETLESLKNEGIFVESAYLDLQGNDLYLMYYIRAVDITNAYDVFKNSKLAIDHYYKDCWKNYCEGRIVLEELLDIDRFDF